MALRLGSALGGVLVCSSVVGAQQPSVPPAPSQAPASGVASPQGNALVQRPDVVMKQCPVPGSSTNATATISTAVTGGDWVELRRTRCNGICPAYTVRLGADGSVRWHGEFGVTVAGDGAEQVDAAQAVGLIQQLLDHDFRSLCGSYSRPITDNPTFFTTASVAGQTVQVSDYAASAPAWLRDFDDRIDALADTHRWRHGDAARELFSDRRLVQDARMSKPGRSLMMKAAATGDRGAIELLLEKQTPVDAEDASGWTALMYAAGAGPMDQVRQLLAAGASAAHQSRSGETLLFAAVWSPENAVGRLQVLQKAGANVEATSAGGSTVLMIAAAHYWHPEVIKALLDLGADASVRNTQGRTALDLLEQAHAKDGATQEGYGAARALLGRGR